LGDGVKLTNNAQSGDWRVETVWFRQAASVCV